MAIHSGHKAKHHHKNTVSIAENRSRGISEGPKTACYDLDMNVKADAPLMPSNSTDPTLSFDGSSRMTLDKSTAHT